jgi:hypothetical protein
LLLENGEELNLQYLGSLGLQDTPINLDEDSYLYIDGHGDNVWNGYLYINGIINDVNSFSSLFVYSSEEDLYQINTHKDLFIYGDQNDYENYYTLYIQNEETGYLNQDHTLYIDGDFDVINESIEFVIYNNGPSLETNLYIQGQGISEYYYPYSDTATLFINRPDESVSLNMFCKAMDDVVNTFSTLHIISTDSPDPLSIDLSIPNVKSQDLNTYSSLFVKGKVDSELDINLVVYKPYDSTNEDMTLFIKQGNVLLNSYSSMYVAGAYLDEGEMTLSIPNVIDDLNNYTQFYIVGW